MQRDEALKAMSALSQPTRLRVVEILRDAGDEGMASSGMADAVGVPRHLMSAHLSILSKAGLIAGVKSGRSVVYRVRTETLDELAGYILSLARAPK
jgi:DNA-binding transcriptional ArsR family regulator